MKLTWVFFFNLFINHNLQQFFFFLHTSHPPHFGKLTPILTQSYFYKLESLKNQNQSLCAVF